MSYDELDGIISMTPINIHIYSNYHNNHHHNIDTDVWLVSTYNVNIHTYTELIMFNGWNALM